jgi:glycosyltransferase involved in cell wall biosynthesis
MTSGPLVSVIIPTYHRPDMLRTAVSSVLSQLLPGAAFEVLIAVSDRDSEEDLAAAMELADSDERVRVVVADRLGPGAARNKAIAVARGTILAFTDDDCEAAPGWLNAGVHAITGVDIVQGRTLPPEARSTRRERTISVEKLSYLWQTCNLFVQRSAVDRTGGFDEDWNPTGRPGGHWGEDAEWGSRLVRDGATYVFEPNAEVTHALWMRSRRDVIVHKLSLRYFPMLVRRAPEVRKHLYHGYFLNPQQATLTLSFVIFAVAGTAAIRGSTKVAVAGSVAGAAAALWPPKTSVPKMLVSTANEIVSYVMVVYGSIRYRRLVL